MTILQNNKKAYLDYAIEDTFEAGLVLEGWEVKSIQNHQVSFTSSFIKKREDGLYWIGGTIPSWKHGEPKSKVQQNRDKKLLLKKREINRIGDYIDRAGYAIIPLKIYRSDNNYIKLEIGIAKGRKKFDKRQALKDKDLKRRIDADRKKYNF